jgi:hypothetical protein
MPRLLQESSDEDSRLSVFDAVALRLTHYTTEDRLSGIDRNGEQVKMDPASGEASPL